MSRKIQWLQSQISQWLSEGIIDSGQAEQLLQRYSSTGTPWTRMILSSIGAIVFGLGIILLFAYNWSQMPRFLKLGLIIGSLTLVHGLGVHFARAGNERHSLVEGLHILGTMLFGAGIWLIAQIYHMDEHYPDALFIWGSGALAMAWVIPSAGQGIIAVVLFSMWSGFELFDFQSNYRLTPLIFLAGLIPLAWLYRYRSLLFFSLTGFLLQLIFQVVDINHWLGFYPVFFAASLLVALAACLRESNFPEGIVILRRTGFFIYLVMLYILGFDLHYLHTASVPETDRVYYLLVLSLFLLLGAVAWIAVFVSGSWRRQGSLKSVEYLLMIVVTVLVLLVHLQIPGPLPGQAVWALPWMFSIALVAHSLVLVVDGTQQVSWVRVSVGSVMLAVVLGARFADLFDSLLMRSLLFLLLGAGLFLIGNFYSRQKEKRGNKNA